ncbi:MFS transporter [Azospirillum sp. TSO35-2]|uniref:MFS transporter n=1 Tax=Azospirillum sp. TSO35-2 TaxID=716796 RepID=UPI000D60A96D|nr:MFS transporter [Azospirillum sp. TSO35-2]PWC36012.1 MFS transporter [Azospirillum sp. TSO35-2]
MPQATPTTEAAPTPRLNRSQWRVIGLASLGGSLEYYDFIIYGIFAQYIAKQFFPAGDAYVSLILSFSVLALGFLARPLGGIVLSTLGDRYGRRPVFLGSLVCTTVSTILIGLLPSYETLGLAAPLILVGLRLVQGICLGGELPGALTYAVEAAPQRSGLACGFIILCVNVGVLVATLVNLGIQYALPPADVASYGWRIAFLLGGFIGCVSYLLRRSLEESPEFLRMHSRARNPIRELLREHWNAVLTGAGVAAVVGGFNGMLYGFVPAYLVQTLHYSPSQTALAMMTALLVSSAGLIVAGWVGDYLPRHLVLRVGSGLLMVAVVPIWSRIAAGSDQLILLMALLSLAFAISSGIWPSILANLFPTRVRFSGIALSYNVSITVLSGFAPLAASAMIGWSGMPSAPAVYIAACTLLTFASTFASRRTDAGPSVMVAAEASPEAV